MDAKNKQTSGADQATPSIPQYFSWLNNTNEGATQTQTLINLAYFKWLKNEYGMQIKLYAWDAGNLDGSNGTYAAKNKEKLQKQFPEGYGPIARAAAETGIRLGVWCGADGFGNTPEEEKARRELIIRLCRDYNFMEFKVDAVCDWLREEKQPVFAQMIRECRSYCPDLILLNHRNNLGPAELYATTTLWEGAETYIDVWMSNSYPAPHHRAGALSRGLTPNLDRLSEDHGICLSSCLDFFEDELILQAFSRALILAPEIYGNPWLLKDEEQAKLARIYVLQARYAQLLTSGMLLPKSYGMFPVSRGDGRTRLITLRNLTWEEMTINIKLDEEIGLANCAEAAVIIHHPYEEFVGLFHYGEQVSLKIPPFRSFLAAIVEKERFNSEYLMLTNCKYQVIYDFPLDTVSFNGTVSNAADEHTSELKHEGDCILINGPRSRMKLKLVQSDGSPIAFAGAARKIALKSPPSKDDTLKAPVFLGALADCPYPDNAQALYEATCFRASSDSLEAQSAARAGESAFPAVRNARTAFFGQATYMARGCESSALFDGRHDTFFDALSRYYGTRLHGGCLRIDLKNILEADSIEIDYFEAAAPIYEVPAQAAPRLCDYSLDLENWQSGQLENIITLEETFYAPVVMHTVHNIKQCCGRLRRASYGINGSLRYFRLADPMDRIYAVRIIKNGRLVEPEAPSANNMLAHYSRTDFKYAQKIILTLPDFKPGSYLAAAVEEMHGAEEVYCAAFSDGQYIGFDDRAPSFPVNHWESPVTAASSCYTYYLHLPPKIQSRSITVYALCKNPDTKCSIYLCDANYSHT